MEDELVLERATPHNIVARRCRSAASHYTKSALEPAHAKSGDKHAVSALHSGRQWLLSSVGSRLFICFRFGVSCLTDC